MLVIDDGGLAARFEALDNALGTGGVNAPSAGLEFAPIVGAEFARWGELQQDGAFWQFCLAGQLECASRDGHSGSDCAAGCDAWGAVGCALRHAAMVGGGRV